MYQKALSHSYMTRDDKPLEELHTCRGVEPRYFMDTHTHEHSADTARLGTSERARLFRSPRHALGLLEQTEVACLEPAK